MELSNKKKIAESVMGWNEILKDYADENYCQWDNGKEAISSATFQPLGSHYWDIIEAVTPEQDAALNEKFIDKVISNDEFENLLSHHALSKTLSIMRWGNKNREAVISALLEILTQNKG